MNATAERVSRCRLCGAWVYANRDCTTCNPPAKPRLYDWMEEAACKDLPTEDFFLERGTSHGPARDAIFQAEIQTALRICAGCPVRAKCLDYGMEDDYGIFGGLLPSQRKLLRAKTNNRRKGNGSH